MTVSEVLSEMVAFPTPSSLSNLPLIEWVRGFVDARGWRAELFPYTDENGVSKVNMIARPASAPPGDWIDFAFICHTDTVPYASAWSDALRLQRGDGAMLHGCGACDVKGALACFLTALDQAAPNSPRPNTALILTADEEIGCKGMDRLLAATHLHIRSAIVSEPTSLRPGIAGKGYGLARVTVRGVEAHSAFPSEGASAIVIAARLITLIEEQTAPAAATPSADAALFDPSRTTVNIGVIQGGSAKNIVAGECSFLVEWRPLPGEDPRGLLTTLDQIATQIRTDHPRAQIHIELLRAERGFAPYAAGPLQQALRRLDDLAPVGISFGSEASRLARVADEVIVIGPGDMHTAHSDRECVPIAELDTWTSILGRLFFHVDRNS